MNQTIVTLMIFIITYIMLLLFQNKKSTIAFIIAFAITLIGIIPLSDAIKSIDFNILLMILGTMGTVSLFIESKMPSLLADLLIRRSNNMLVGSLFLAVFAGIISAFVDNIATVLMIAPIPIMLAKKKGISPVPMLISISIFSNLEGAATLVGDKIGRAHV